MALTGNEALWAVVPAAGSGQRMAAVSDSGQPLAKQYLILGTAEQTVIETNLRRLLSLSKLKQVTVVISPEDNYWSGLGLEEQLTQEYSIPVVSATGAATRAASVLNGVLSLSAQAADDDWVLVHDAARPCVRMNEVELLLELIATSKVGGILASPVENTLKLADGMPPFALRTIDRSALWYAYTPQIFRYGLLKKALRAALAASSPITDEAAAVEALGYQPLLLEASRDNIKITQPSDLKLAENILSSQ